MIGIVTGPFIGLATAWLRERDLHAALGTAVLAGVAIGEGLHGSTRIADTTSPVYWTTIVVVGAVLLTTMLVMRIRGVLPIATAVVGTAMASVAVGLAFGII